MGAGKSTLLSFLDVSVIKEPVDEWSNTAGSNILERYYSDPKRWAFTFQLNALHSRSQLWHSTLAKQPLQQHFSERSPMADRYIFGEIMRSEGNMDASEFSIYDNLCNTLMADCPLEAIIYLKCDPAICYERIKKRNRTGEECIPLSYLQKVHDRHEEWISRQKGVQLLTVDTGAYDVENPEELGQLIALIQDFIKALH